MTQPTRWGLGYFSHDGKSFTGLVVHDEIRDLCAEAEAFKGLDLAVPAGSRSLLERWEHVFPTLDRLAADNSHGTWYPADAVRTLAPLEPRQILQAGANYRTHVVDLAVAHTELSHGRTVEQVRADAERTMDERKATGSPYLFIGLPSAVTGPYDDVILPSYSQKHDWELELAAVIGSPAFRVSPNEALDHVAAYVIANDLTTRDAVFRRDMPEIGADWFRSKNAPGFLPLGPWLIPSAFVGDPQSLQLQLKLNGDMKQDALATDMLFSVAELVSAASQTAVLSPGDLVLTGSPAGNGAHWGRLLRDGDVMESTITGLGHQRTVVAYETAQGAKGEA
ncbi:MAG: fumarylacetoacetate hydrolase family protein [Lacisediminihabitans sp.]